MVSGASLKFSVAGLGGDGCGDRDSSAYTASMILLLSLEISAGAVVVDEGRFLTETFSALLLPLLSAIISLCRMASDKLKMSNKK